VPQGSGDANFSDDLCGVCLPSFPFHKFYSIGDIKNKPKIDLKPRKFWILILRILKPKL